MKALLCSLCLGFFALGSFVWMSPAAETGEPAAPALSGLDDLPRPWEKPIHRLSFAEYDTTLKYWAEVHPQLFTLQKRGESHDGQPVYLVKITDAAVPDENKQVALVSALHGGPERSGTTTCLHLMEWLLGDSAEARETRQKQVVLVVPLTNPHAFFKTDRFGNKEHIELYDPELKWWDLKKLTLVAPEKTPELAAFLSIVDEYQPEVHLDLHGTGLQAFPSSMLKDRHMKQGQTMFEVSACSYSNCGVRPWDPRVTEVMVQAGIEAGFGSDRAEADAQRCFWNADHDVWKNRLWRAPRAGRFRSLFYGYMKYHTMISTTEVGWEQSGVSRVAGILALGNKTWVDETQPGYPVSRVRARAGRFVTAYGQTAAERRRSRVELWQAQEGFVDGMLYPEFEGRATYICAVTPRGKAALNAEPAEFLANLKELPEMKMEALKKYFSLGPEHRVTAAHKISKVGQRLQHGFGVRLRIPHRSPKLLHVALNGHDLTESATDGYQAWYADGFTQLQINVPPEKTKEMDLYVITCGYDSQAKLTYGWEPPAAVKARLKKN